MNRMEAISWVLSISVGLRLSQSKTLSELVSVAMTVGRISLAELGRGLAGTTAKHGIKRAWRFVSNERVHISDAMEGVVRRLIRPKRKKPLLVSIDWVEIRQFHCISLCAVIRGRAIPLLWASYPEWELHRSQNNLEEGLLRLFRTMVGEHVRVIILGDRGFGRAELLRVCQQLNFSYVIRIKADVWLESPRFTGKLLDYPVKKGIAHCLRNVQYRRERPVTQNVAIFWRKGLPTCRDECWFLATNLPARAARLVALYAKRMSIEEFFRDHKSRRNGFALRNTQLRSAANLDRLLLILALAYILLVAIGCKAKRTFCPSNWATNTRQSECSVFTIGKIMRERIHPPFNHIIQILIEETKYPIKNWG